MAAAVTAVSDDIQDSDIRCDPVQFSDEDENNTVVNSGNEGLAEQLQYNLAAFFLKMQTICRVSERATQELIEHIDQLFTLSEPLVRESVIKTLQKQNCPVTDTLVSEIVVAVSECNILHKSIESEGPLSTAKRRKTYYEENFPFVKPVEYLGESAHSTILYVPILTALQV